MTFDNADFWVVAGTAAPVVALAAVVSLGDGLRTNTEAFGEALQALRDSQRVGVLQDRETQAEIEANAARVPADRREVSELATDQFRKDAAKATTWLIGIGLANLFLQAGLLAVALVSLTDGASLVQPWIAIVAAVGGLVLLAIGALRAAHLRTKAMFARFTNVPLKSSS